MKILCHTDRDLVPFPVNSPSETEPQLAIVQLSSPERQSLALQFLRKRIAVALYATENNLDFLKVAAACAHRNHVALVLLDSWRYIPAAAAAKEMADSGCLGILETCTIAAPCHHELDRLRIQDLASWLGAPLTYQESSLNIQLTLTGSHGNIHSSFSLDGQHADFLVNLGNHSHTRHIPVADPHCSELAILTLSLPPVGKIKTLPLLHTL